MDHFSVIQEFMKQLQCPHCGSHLQEGDVALLREEQNLCLVDVYCHHCDTAIGTAMMGVQERFLGNDDEDDSNVETLDFESFLEEIEASASSLSRLSKIGKASAFKRFQQRQEEALEDDDDAPQLPQFAGMFGGRLPQRRYKDPELTPAEKERLSAFSPISEDDVLNAHHTIASLDAGWMSLIPPEMLARCSSTDTESPSA